MITQALSEHPEARPTQVLHAAGIAMSCWYDPPIPPETRRRPGPAPKSMPELIEQAVVQMATTNLWYGYTRIAVMCRRSGVGVSNRQCFVSARPPIRWWALARGDVDASHAA